MIFPRVLRLDVTYRKAEEMKDLESKVTSLEHQVENLKVEMHRFALYAAENLRLYDDLRQAKELLDAAGIDSSFIRLGRGLYKA